MHLFLANSHLRRAPQLAQAALFDFAGASGIPASARRDLRGISLSGAHLATLRLLPVNVHKGCSVLSGPEKGFYYR
jgi:hypothetical protein